MSHPNPPAAARPRSTGRVHLYPKLVLGALGLALLILLLELLWGESTRVSWALYAGACGVGLLAWLGWRLLARGLARGGSSERFPGWSAWLGFSLCFFSLLALIPLLVLSVSSAARVYLDPRNRISAAFHDDCLEIIFPDSMAEPGLDGGAINLTFDEQPIPSGFFQAHPESHSWEDLQRGGDRKRLLLQWRILELHLGVSRPRRIGINAQLQERQFLDATRRRIPQQWVRVE
jgi:hypothetical protein